MSFLDNLQEGALFISILGLVISFVAFVNTWKFNQLQRKIMRRERIHKLLDRMETEVGSIVYTSDSRTGSRIAPINGVAAMVATLDQQVFKNPISLLIVDNFAKYLILRQVWSIVVGVEHIEAEIFESKFKPREEEMFLRLLRRFERRVFYDSMGFLVDQIEYKSIKTGAPNEYTSAIIRYYERRKTEDPEFFLVPPKR